MLPVISSYIPIYHGFHPFHHPLQVGATADAAALAELCGAEGVDSHGSHGGTPKPTYNWGAPSCTETLIKFCRF